MNLILNYEKLYIYTKIFSFMRLNRIARMSKSIIRMPFRVIIGVICGGFYLGE